VLFTRIHLAEVVSLVLSRLPPARVAKMYVKDGRPGSKFLRAFEKRHADRIKLLDPAAKKMDISQYAVLRHSRGNLQPSKRKSPKTFLAHLRYLILMRKFYTREIYQQCVIQKEVDTEVLPPDLDIATALLRQ